MYVEFSRVEATGELHVHALILHWSAGPGGTLPDPRPLCLIACPN